MTDACACADALKYRNFTGTLFAPTNNALRNFGAGTGIDIERPSMLPRALVRSIIEYHVLFDTIDVSLPAHKACSHTIALPHTQLLAFKACILLDQGSHSRPCL